MKAQEAKAVEMGIIRVLVADDFELWRSYVVAALAKVPELRVVGTAEDGADAVRMAEELQPDLILIDVRLPILTGVEAAGEIRKRSPKVRIIFVSGETDPEVVRSAFRAGANGFICKSDAAEGLRAGITAVLLGRTFVSRSLTHPDDLSETSE